MREITLPPSSLYHISFSEETNVEGTTECFELFYSVPKNRQATELLPWEKETEFDVTFSVNGLSFCTDFGDSEKIKVNIRFVGRTVYQDYRVKGVDFSNKIKGVDELRELLHNVVGKAREGCNSLSNVDIFDIFKTILLSQVGENHGE